MKNRAYSTILWVLLTMFCFRVFAQLFPYYFNSGYLPPFEDFRSGTLPYNVLVAFQFIIIAIYLTTCLRISNGSILAKHEKGKRLFILGSVYLAVMVTRYFLRMAMFPSERWLGGTIPIYFHVILATFI